MVKISVPFKVGDLVQLTSSGQAGIVQRIREHEPVHIGVLWQDGSGLQWVPLSHFANLTR